MSTNSIKDDNPYYQGQDAYQILGVPRGSDVKTIKAAFKKQVATWHPDKFPDNPNKRQEGELRMQKINRAWFCLGDDDRKRRYDQYGEAGVGTSAASEEQLKNNGGPGFSGFGGGGGQAVDIGDMGDIFDAFFNRGGGGGGFGGAGFGGGGNARGARRATNGPQRGEDLEAEVDIPFMTGVFGGKETIKIRRTEECKTCKGSGTKPGTKVKTCSVCQGQGAVSQMQRTPFGVFSQQMVCPQCKGQGQEVEEYCGTCRGKGTTLEMADVSLNVPAGVETGSVLRVKDAGNSGRRGGPRGDLLVQLRVQADRRFRREGIDILTEEEISYYDAVLGTTLSTETVDGKMEVKINPGTQPNQKLRIRGAGVPRLGGAPGQRGDAIITVKVKIPTSIGEKEQELVKQIASLYGKK